VREGQGIEYRAKRVWQAGTGATITPMTAYGFTLFDTAIGWCGVAWTDRGLAGVQLPEASEADTRERMLRRFPAAAETAPPAEVQRAIGRIVALLHGGRDDLSAVVLGMGE